LEDTAAFIDAHLASVRSFPSPQALLRHALTELPGGDQGLVCEFGVYRGASLRLIAEALPHRTVFGFDSFEGLPDDWFDGFRRGTFKVERLPAVPRNAALVQGWFSDTLGPFLTAHPGDALFLHVDCDLYSSAKCVLDAFDSRIRAGTIIVFDEYFNYVGWREGEFKAFAELVERTHHRFEYLGYCRSREQAAVRIL
jgi:hypothetical protein